ncbi:VPS35 endosomal protein-sorting factor-like isoform 3-T3 [Salvelinus alpinus]|uniref:VPS35 endosomal protein-sorting factor-like isoform X3 n=1 Tax=Salvelinus alpinus TaxID=8036 RepID=UPI0039FCE7A0
MIHASIILISSFSQKREVNTVLSDIIKHIMPDHAFEDAYAQFQSVIRKTLTYFHDFSILFSMERFLPFVDMFQKDSVRVKVCLSIMDVFINALTLEDEKRSLALLINGFIRMAVNQLAMETSCVMRGSHSHKTAALVRVRTLEFIKRQAQQPDMVQHLTLQSRT